LVFEMAPQVGQVLRRARTERGIELDEVERVTKIRKKFLLAMEEDRWEELPAPAYARGFLDIYARFLGLDHRALLDDYTRSIEGVEPQEPIPYRAVQPGLRTHIRWKHRPPLKPVALVTAVAAAVVLGAVIIESIAGSDNGGGIGPDRHRARGAAATSPSRVSVELRSTADVWVCAVDDRERAVVDGETLTAGESRGPFTGQDFELTFGNGSIKMTLNGEPVRVPPIAEPISYRVTTSGASRLDPDSGPSCL
jgi:Helix-turn-helix domain/RodZ C-terminal domain